MEKIANADLLREMIGFAAESIAGSAFSPKRTFENDAKSRATWLSFRQAESDPRLHPGQVFQFERPAAPVGGCLSPQQPIRWPLFAFACLPVDVLMRQRRSCRDGAHGPHHNPVPMLIFNTNDHRSTTTPCRRGANPARSDGLAMTGASQID